MQSDRSAAFLKNVPKGLLTAAEAVQRAEELLFPAKSQELRATFDEQLFLSSYLDAKRARAMLSRQNSQTDNLLKAKEELDRLAQVPEEKRHFLHRAQARIELGVTVWKELQQRLGSGKLSSYVLTADGSITPIPPHVWHKQIPTGLPYPEEISFAANNLIEHKGRPFFRASEIETVLGPAPDAEADLSAREQPATSVVAPKDVGGAPPKFDKEAFLTEAFKLLYNGFVPKSQAELRKKALDAYSMAIRSEDDKPAEIPSDDWAKPIIRRLWNRLGLERKG